MNHDKIRNAITKDSSDDFDALYRLLYARGFLVQKDAKGIFIGESENVSGYNRPSSNRADCFSWQDLLGNWRETLQPMNGMIHVEGDRITACTEQFSIQQIYNDLFTKEIHLVDDTVITSDSFLRYFQMPQPAILKPMVLDPFVALYVNVMNEIEIETSRSCQGKVGHSGDPFYIDFANCYFVAFHNALWETEAFWSIDTILRDINIKWRTPNNCKLGSFFVRASIQLTDETVDDIYVNIIRAAQYLYENRDGIQKLRLSVANDKELRKYDEESTNEGQYDTKNLTKIMVELINKYSSK